MSFNYHFEPLNTSGKTFTANRTLLASLGLPPAHFTELTNENADDFVAVTATSSNHFAESVDAVASVQKHMPNRRIIYYNLGLTEKQLRAVSIAMVRVERELDLKLYYDLN